MNHDINRQHELKKVHSRQIHILFEEIVRSEQEAPITETRFSLPDFIPSLNEVLGQIKDNRPDECCMNLCVQTRYTPVDDAN